MKVGNIIFVYTVDGEELIVTYIGDNRGFLLFDDKGNTIALRPSSILTVTDTEKAASSIQPMNLKKTEEEDLPTEIIPVKRFSPRPPPIGRLHL